MHTTLGKCNFVRELLDYPLYKGNQRLFSSVIDKLLLGSFESETPRKVNEYESRYNNPTTQQDASHTFLLKYIYVGIRKVFNDKPIIFHSSRLKLLHL